MDSNWVSADFCLIPIGTQTASLTKYIAEAVKVVKESGLSYTLHGHGTTVEGDWDKVMNTIHQALEAVHKLGVERISTSVRLGTCKGMNRPTSADKAKRVEEYIKEHP